jgi:hypothetical protein
VDLDVEGYAAIMVELAATPEVREVVLARHGLGEADWEALDNHFQGLLSEAMADDSDGVPEILARYAAAYEAAQRAQGEPISLERFAQVTRLLHVTGDIRASLARANVTMAQYVRASEHWSRLLAQDPELERRFDEAMRR